MPTTPPDEKLLDSPHEELLPPEPPELTSGQDDAPETVSQHHSTPTMVKLLVTAFIIVDILLGIFILNAKSALSDKFNPYALIPTVTPANSPTPTPTATPKATPTVILPIHSLTPTISISTPTPSATAPSPTPTVSPSTYSISGYVYKDESNNGARDNGEMIIPGASVFFLSIGKSVTTDSTGRYNISGLTPGTYNISANTQNGMTSIGDNPAFVTITNSDGAHDFGFH